MRKSVFLLLLFLCIVFLMPAGLAAAQDESVSLDTDTKDISDEFIDIVDYLYEDEGLISTNVGDYYFVDDYTDEWAQMYWYQWSYLTDMEIADFVIRAKITWKSASDTPQWADSGCGFVFREQDADNHLKANLALDGNVYINGARNANWLSYGTKSFDRHSTSGSAYFTLAASGSDVTVMIDDSIVHQARNVAMTDPGYLAFVVVSGTNKGFGTRCEFEEVEIFVIE